MQERRRDLPRLVENYVSGCFAQSHHDSLCLLLRGH